MSAQPFDDPETIEVRSEEQLDTTRLEPYLRAHLEGAEGPLGIRQFGGDHANLTYLVRFGEREWVLRRPPLGPVDDGLQLRERLAWLATVAMRDGSWEGIPGTETSTGVRTRVLGALDAIATRHPGERVVVVSHAGAINAALGAIASSDHDFLFPLANASVSVVRIGNNRRLLMSANETAHLAAIPSRSAR